MLKFDVLTKALAYEIVVNRYFVTSCPLDIICTFCVFVLNDSFY